MNNNFNLKEKKWLEFKIDDVFNVFTGALISKQEQNLIGNIPRITATELNNGIGLFTNDIDSKNFRTHKNFISISFLGGVFYHKNKASLDMKIHGLQIKGRNLNKYISLFLIPLIYKFSNKYNYGNQLNSSSLRQQRIMLPSVDGFPDWNFMENYIKEKYINFNSKLINKTNIDLINLKNKHKKNDNDKKWSNFVLKDIFNIESTKSGIDKINLNLESGITPYITRSNLNNGIDAFVAKQQDNKYKINKGNVISIGLDTQTVFYQENDFYTGQNIQILSNEFLTKNIAMFLIVSLKKQMIKFNWGGNGATLSRLKRSKVVLPINNVSNPDWDYMEGYIIDLKIKQKTKLISNLRDLL